MTNLKKINDKLDKANRKLKDIVKQDVSVVSKIVFTSDTEFYYVFNVIRKGDIIDKVRANNVSQYDKAFKDLANKYEVNIIYDYSDLTFSQLKYLSELDTPNKVEKGELDSLYLDTMLNF